MDVNIVFNEIQENPTQWKKSHIKKFFDLIDYPEGYTTFGFL